MHKIKNLFLFIISFIMFFTLSVTAEPSKVTSLNYDDSSSLVFIGVEKLSEQQNTKFKYVRLENPNRIYFDINDAVLIGPKQQLAFEKSKIKQIRLAQFSTNPDIVRAVITFDEDFDTSNIHISDINGSVIIKTDTPKFTNDYFNPLYDETAEQSEYSGITANSEVVQKVPVTTPVQSSNKENANVINDIQKAFTDSTLNNSDGKTYDSVVSIDISSDLKLRTKYFINGYYQKNGGLLVSGLGQMTVSKVFMLDSPKRIVVDMPNTYVDKKIRNNEINLCSDGSCKDTAKIGQFDSNTARIVVTTDKPEMYIPVYSSDSQSLMLINANKLNHTSLVSSVANIQKAYVKKLSGKKSELILSFTQPVVHSIVRNDNSLTIYLFNVKSYNEPDMIKILNGTQYKSLTLSLLPQIGVKADIKIKKEDIVQIAQSVDGKAMRLTLTTSKDTKVTEPAIDTQTVIKPKKPPIKNKVVLDPGHGGTDYGAIRDGINEKDLTLDITQRVASILKSKGYKYAMTRTDDTYLGLQERCDYSEAENPEIFVSIHVNSAVATEPSGLETHYFHEPSRELAETIQKHMVKNIDSKDRGIIKSKFYVINHTDVPAVLVETGFLSNPDERAELVTEKRKDATAKAIAEGIIEYLKNNK